MRGNAAFSYGAFRLPHHLLERRIGFNLVQTILQVGINLDCLANHEATIPAPIGRRFIEQFIGSLVENKLFAHSNPRSKDTFSIEFHSTLFMNSSEKGQSSGLAAILNVEAEGDEARRCGRNDRRQLGAVNRIVERIALNR